VDEDNQVVDYVGRKALLFDVLGKVLCVVLEHDKWVLEVDLLDDLLGLAVVVTG
jgi:hypothetical protein